MIKPKDCKGKYVPWICGFCTCKRKCRVMGGR